jgi:hypothetical protein
VGLRLCPAFERWRLQRAGHENFMIGASAWRRPPDGRDGATDKADDLTAKRLVGAIRAGNTCQCAAQLGGIRKARLLE